MISVVSQKVAWRLPLTNNNEDQWIDKSGRSVCQYIPIDGLMVNILIYGQGGILDSAACCNHEI